MAKSSKLKAPDNLTIDFKPSPRQYEVWKSVQPECPLCGGNVTMVERSDGTSDPICDKCGNDNIPQISLEGGAAGGGKALGMNESVLTPSGFVKMKDVKLGMKVNTQSGNVAEIIAIHPQGKKRMYKLTTSDGIESICCGEHIWKVGIASKKGSSEEIINTSRIIKLMNEGKVISIPQSSAQKFGKKYDGMIHPYIIGALLGDGGLTDGVTYCSADKFIIDKIQSLLPDGCEIGRVPSQKYGYSITNKSHDNMWYMVSNFKNELRRLKMMCRGDKKRVPEAIMRSDLDTRKQCLAGLMDSDGYVDERGHCSFSVCNKGLAEDFLYLIRSVGARATLTSTEKSCVYKGVKKYATSWNVIFNAGDEQWDIVSLPRKRDRLRKTKPIPRKITSIEDAGMLEAQCITISDQDGMFVTNGFLPTHNSYLGSVWLLSSCIKFPDIRAVIGRKTLKTLKESTMNTLFSVMRAWGLKEDEHYNYNSVEGVITFWNDSKIIMKEMADLPSDPNFERFGGGEYTIAFIDEVSEISHKAIEVLFSRLRWNISNTFKTSKLLMSTNPCMGWVRDRFVQDNDGNRVVCAKGDCYIPFRVDDNPDKQFVAHYKRSLQKIRDVATRERLLEGNWNFVDSNAAAFYREFDGSKHLHTALKSRFYDKNKPLILSFDFNVHPYMSCLVSQMDYELKRAYFIEEILGTPDKKLNNTPALSKFIFDKYKGGGHKGGFIITGDPSGLSRSSQTAEGVNNFSIIKSALKELQPTQRLLNTQPPQSLRGQWINEIFKESEIADGWSIWIDMKCRKLTEDLIYQLSNEDGTKDKSKVKDPETGVKYEKYGHMSDNLDYTLCLFLQTNWYKYKRGGTTYSPPASAVIKQTFNY